MTYLEIYEKQRAYFDSGATRSYEARLEALKKLRKAVQEGSAALEEALKKNAEYEAALSEIEAALEVNA